MNTDAIESMVRDVLSRMNSLQGDAPAAAPAAGGTSRSAKVSDYPLAMNFERAAELTAVPDDRILEIYNALRPYRSTKEELLAIAADLENRYQAKICAAFVREAAGLYVERKKLKGDD
ncbi:TPA: hypothetical protein G9B43_002334 [Salmonella enterica]|nr:hypothetical protein [Salmonella enterica]